MKIVVRLVVIFFLSLVSISVNATENTGVTFEVTGNTKTDPRVIAQELVQANNGTFTQADAEASEKAIMALGLFESVEINIDESESPPKLKVEVKEKKHDWYVLPRLNRNGDGDISVGIDWRENNLNGLNQRLKLSLAQKKFDNASKDKESWFNVGFLYPRIVGTDFSASFDTTLLNVGIDETRDGIRGTYERNQFSLGAGIGRWFGKSKASQGLLLYLGGRYTKYEHELETGSPGLFFDADVVSVEANAVYRHVYDNLFSREGHEYGIRFDKASAGFGSDVDYLHQTAFYRRYQPVGSVPHTNLNFQVQLGTGNRSVFGDPIYDLSGDLSLRGFARETLEGNAFLVVNTEYLRPLFGRSNVRGALLLDFGNAYSSLSDIGDLDLEVGAGVGIRWKFKSWVNTELRIDAAYGFGDLGGTRVYVSTDATF